MQGLLPQQPHPSSSSRRRRRRRRIATKKFCETSGPDAQQPRHRRAPTDRHPVTQPEHPSSHSASSTQTHTVTPILSTTSRRPHLPDTLWHRPALCDMCVP